MKKQITKKFHRIVQIPIYKTRFIVAIGEDITEIAKDYQLESHEEYKGTACFVCELEGKPPYLLAIETSEITNHGNIAHDCLHLVHYIWKDISAGYDCRNDEPQAYLLGYLVNEVHKVIKSYESTTTKTKSKLPRRSRSKTTKTVSTG